MTVIAVNGAIDWLPDPPDYWFSLDMSDANLQRVHAPRARTQYCVAVPPEYPTLPPHVRRFRRVARRGLAIMPHHGSPEWWLWRWSAMRGLSNNPECIHSGNSAWGALGLAYHLGAERVALVGVDANSGSRVEGGAPHNLSHLPLLFNSALGQIDLVNCGAMQSLVPRMSVNEGMQWLLS